MLAARLQVQERNFGSPGTGYASTGAGGAYVTRLAEVLAADPQVVVVSGGRNDVYEDPATIASNARALFVELRRRLPHAVVVAVSPLWGSSEPLAQLAGIATSVRSAVLAAGGRYLNVADPLRGHPNLMSNISDPNDSGYREIAAVLAPAVSAAVVAVR